MNPELSRGWNPTGMNLALLGLWISALEGIQSLDTVTELTVELEGIWIQRMYRPTDLWHRLAVL